MQEGEAAQDRASSASSGSPFVSPLDTARAICEAADEICGAAKRSREDDAAERCRRARGRCDAAMGAATGQ